MLWMWSSLKSLTSNPLRNHHQLHFLLLLGEFLVRQDNVSGRLILLGKRNCTLIPESATMVQRENSGPQSGIWAPRKVHLVWLLRFAFPILTLWKVNYFWWLITTFRELANSSVWPPLGKNNEMTIGIWSHPFHSFTAFFTNLINISLSTTTIT